MDTGKATSVGAAVHAPGTPTYELHTLGWRSFQDLCAVVAREVWNESAQPFADTRDAGRDGAFYGKWKNGSTAPLLSEAPYVLQCKFVAVRDKTLTLSSIQDELSKIRKLVSDGLCQSYILMSNARITGTSEARIRKAILAQGATDAHIFGGQWINHTIALNQRLRMFVPRVYGLGDLSSIMDERAYSQAKALLDYLQEDLATFVVTDAYRRAADAISKHKFCLLLGEPAVGKSVIAATLAMTALDSWKCPTIRADGPEDIVTHWNPNEPNQFFWIDDAFGSVRHEQALTDDWARRLPKVMAAVKGGARVVMTSRDYIYRAARPFLKEYSYPLLREQHVVIDVAELAKPERQQIIYNHIRCGDQPKKFRTALKPHLDRIADQDTFRPEVARRLGQQTFTCGLTISDSSVEEFMTKPNQFLQDIYQGLEPDHIGALALVYQSGDLPVPLEIQSSERRDLLTLVGSSLSGAAGALEILEGTFLRRARKMGTDNDQEYWSFRHPTLREGYAAFVASKPNLLRLFIEGLDDNGILTQLDCGGGEKQGTLVQVPPSLYQPVAQRVADARLPRRDRDSDNWLQRYLWTGFLASRCSRGFFDAYMRIDPKLVDRCLNIGSYISTQHEIAILARMHELGLLSEKARQSVRDTVSELAIETPDGDWIDDTGLARLLTHQERIEIFDRVRTELLPNLDNIIHDWEFNEQGESAEDYYRPLIDTFDRYREAFDAREDKVASIKFRHALDRVHILETEARHWQDDDPDKPPPPTENGLHELLSKEAPFPAGTGDRSVFDDVDE
ncbi:hypothetical protein ACFZC5_32835 [Nocardia gamkensis]|uniref:nSTAND3 domain-containing NTPase n=1 Tax=Nocardia gamkensis TaxID=352869 RepID=UPI0036E7EE38